MRRFVPNRANFTIFLLIFLLSKDDRRSEAKVLGKQVSKRIIGGIAVQSGDSPFLVSLQSVNFSSRIEEHICGASVISEHFLLTAAHCVIDKVDSPAQLKAYLGGMKSSQTSFSHDNHIHTEDTEEFRKSADRIIDRIIKSTSSSTSKRTVKENSVAIQLEMNIEEVLIHEEYHSEYQLNDIAVLKLVQAIPKEYLSSGAVLPVLLPNTALEKEGYPKAGSNCTVFGWGMSHVPLSETELQTEETEQFAQRVDVEVRNATLCKAFYDYFKRRLELPDYSYLKVFCAGNIGTKGHSGAFKGDSGGPLLCGVKGTYYQAGVVSFGSYDIGAYAPSYYTRVTAYEEWIKQAISR